jgi:hypothetical protein
MMALFSSNKKYIEKNGNEACYNNGLQRLAKFNQAI